MERPRSWWAHAGGKGARSLSRIRDHHGGVRRSGGSLLRLEFPGIPAPLSHFRYSQVHVSASRVPYGSHLRVRALHWPHAVGSAGAHTDVATANAGASSPARELVDRGYHRLPAASGLGRVLHELGNVPVAL